MKKTDIILKNGMQIEQLEDRFEMASGNDSSDTVVIDAEIDLDEIITIYF